MDVLRHGAGVEVVKPAESVAAVRAELAATLSAYR